ncbi:hypothetical protein BHE74_00020936 [Ensete ventricosum]|nr:hypothetical protein GW17_00024271 [Ensete ventricosum]RWW71333.1 hypothetical protein BHE74_00020936 [Ensete ventricosum]RZR86283.1 hypothetical protein BHM03_00013456 [Ensete ventricosum]
MGVSPVETAAQDANGHVIAEEANPAEMPGHACQDAGANVGDAEEGEQEAAAEDDLQGVFVYVASTAVGLALAYIQKVEASEEAVEVQTGLAIEQDAVVAHPAHKAAAQVYEVVVPATAQVGFGVGVGVGVGVEAGVGVGVGVGAGIVVVVGLAPQEAAAAAVAVELPGLVAGAGVKAGPGLESEAGDKVGFGDEVEAAHMMQAVTVLVLHSEEQLAFGVGDTVGSLAVDIEHTVDNAAGKRHSQDTSDSTAGIAIAVAGTIVVERISKARELSSAGITISACTAKNVPAYKRVASPQNGRFRSCHNNKGLDLPRCGSSANRLICTTTTSVSHGRCLFRYIDRSLLHPWPHPPLFFSVPSAPESLPPLLLSPNLGHRFPSSNTDLHGRFVLEAVFLLPRPFGARDFRLRRRASTVDPSAAPAAASIQTQSAASPRFIPQSRQREEAVGVVAPGLSVIRGHRDASSSRRLLERSWTALLLHRQVGVGIIV